MLAGLVRSALNVRQFYAHFPTSKGLSRTCQADSPQFATTWLGAMMRQNIVGGAVVLIFLVLLPYTSNSQQSLRGGTTMVLLANQRSAVLASDSFEHASNAGLTATFTRKV